MKEFGKRLEYTFSGLTGTWVILIDKETTYFSKLVKPRKKSFSRIRKSDNDNHQEGTEGNNNDTEKAERRVFSVAYCLCINEEPEKVCRLFFVNTLGISEHMVKTALKKKVHGTGAAKRDERGRKEESRRFTDTRELKSCREHIKLLKKAPSHYCRDRSKSQYLEDGIKSHAHLYRLYRDLCLENNRQATRSDKYREIFQHEFNLSFFRPKKD